MNILFVCTYNRHRSLTAEHLFKNNPNHLVRSVGTSLTARRKVIKQDIVWSDIIFAMEHKHSQILKEKFTKQLANKEVICLDIPSKHSYMDEELVEILKESLKDYLK